MSDESGPARPLPLALLARLWRLLWKLLSAVAAAAMSVRFWMVSATAGAAGLGAAVLAATRFVGMGRRAGILDVLESAGLGDKELLALSQTLEAIRKEDPSRAQDTESRILRLAESELRPFPVLTRSHPELSLSPREVGILLAKGLTCSPSTTLAPKQQPVTGFVSFEPLYRAMGPDGRRPLANKEKFRCIWEYFASAGPEEVGAGRQLTFRLTWSKEKNLAGRIRSSAKPLCKVDFTRSFIEDAGSELLQVDFANRYVGGGVLGNGTVQEEIRFSICPELLAAMAVTTRVPLKNDECLLMRGAKRFSLYSGYSDSFRYSGPLQEDAHDDLSSSVVVAMDATNYSWSDQEGQFTEEEVNRELLKAFVAFSPTDLEAGSTPTAAARVGVATGAWGCGAFGGDMQLKAVIQWLAASESGRSLVLFCATGRRFEASFRAVVDRVGERLKSTSQLFRILEEFLASGAEEKKGRLFDFILAAVDRDVEGGGEAAVGADAADGVGVDVDGPRGKL